MKTSQSGPFWNSAARPRRGARRALLIGALGMAALLLMLLPPSGLSGADGRLPVPLLTLLLAGAIALGLRSLRAAPARPAQSQPLPPLPAPAADGSYSRAESEYLLDYMYEQARRSRAPLALVVLEVEQYARLCAVFGPTRGAALLDELTRFAAGRLPADAVLLHWDQNSLALLLPASTLGQAVQLASTLAGAIASARFAEFGGIGCRMTISDIGSARHAQAHALARDVEGLIGPATALS